jgi:uncharacterized protein with FMN-binding domain
MTFLLFSCIIGCVNIKSKAQTSININSLEDGVYIGSYRRFLSSAKVIVSIRKGTIKDIKILEKFSSPIGLKAYTIVPQRIINKQSIDIDAVTGATLSSDTIKKAVLDALQKGEIKRKKENPDGREEDFGY